jgi:hypothetical protein
MKEDRELPRERVRLDCLPFLAARPHARVHPRDGGLRIDAGRHGSRRFVRTIATRRRRLRRDEAQPRRATTTQRPPSSRRRTRAILLRSLSIVCMRVLLTLALVSAALFHRFAPLCVQAAPRSTAATTNSRSYARHGTTTAGSHMKRAYECVWRCKTSLDADSLLLCVSPRLVLQSRRESARPHDEGDRRQGVQGVRATIHHIQMEARPEGKTQH